jgi:amino acid transporter
MGRKITAIVLGYLVMFVLVFATLSAAYLALGADRSFRPGTYDVTALWIVASMVLSFLAAVAGGFAAAVIGRGRKVASLLAIVVVVLGVVLAIPGLNAPKTDEVRTADVSNTEAMMKARQPTAMTLVMPVIGALGVLAGARLRKDGVIPAGVTRGSG